LIFSVSTSNLRPKLGQEDLGHHTLMNAGSCTIQNDFVFGGGFCAASSAVNRAMRSLSSKENTSADWGVLHIL
jgi:hypothetical protein